jgi:ABC-2 type transport system ATP-binding protein
VKQLINRVSVDAAFFKKLSPMENLLYAGRLYGLGAQEAHRRGLDILDQLGIARKVALEPMEHMSRGMQQKVAIARAFLTSPILLLLDEPTTGLDPRSRLGMWEVIRGLVREGTTLLLTTQYLDEADELADNIIVIDRGKVIVEGTSDQLKDRVGGDVVAFSVATPDATAKAVDAIANIGDSPPAVSGLEVSVAVGSRGSEALLDVVRRLDAAQVTATGLGIRRPSLDDVFLALTGHVAEETEEASA